jgi:hypothetical protein
MTLAIQTAKHLKDVFFGGNWTAVNLKTVLGDVNWTQATTPVLSFNTIATLVYHIGYYVNAVSAVLQGNALTAKDTYSFTHPPITNEADWQQLVQNTFDNATNFASLIAQLPDEKLEETFIDLKYGTWFRNLQGIIEHTHYHLGQIVLLKKMLHQNPSA